MGDAAEVGSLGGGAGFGHLQGLEAQADGIIVLVQLHQAAGPIQGGQDGGRVCFPVNVLAGNGWVTLQNLVNVLQTQAYVRINNWNGKPHIRYGAVSNVESNKAGFVDFAAMCGEAFPNNCLYVGITLDSSFQASARVSVTSFAKNGFNYNVYANNGQNLTFHFIAFGN